MQLAEPAQVPLDVGKIKVADLIDAQPDIGHQPGRCIAAGRAGANFRQVASSARHPANSTPTCAADGGIRSAARPAPRGRFIHRPGTRPPGRSSGESRPCA